MELFDNVTELHDSDLKSFTLNICDLYSDTRN